ncbi:hypothetical protein DIU38_020850 [Mucilaginibacter sp. P4]|uniref:hypothetical protein n=1 Tax=Mucilaginibacter sp. P4 TaxID=3383180 RepID=UPI0011ED74DB|nr:hypothetical protein [Mucilaginibacter gossypii]QEM18386.1 hypothetical protein DIU38_020850 [Mucilaginibacter gossypii]
MKNRIKTIKSTLFYFYKYGIPSYIIAFGESLGDNLLLTVLSRELYGRRHKNIWVKSNQQQLFEHNPDIKLILPFGALLSGMLLKAFNVKTVFPKYTVYHPKPTATKYPKSISF